MASSKTKSMIGPGSNMVSMKLRAFLRGWTKLVANIRMRDRMVKIMQYGCQMLLGYYGSKVSQELRQGWTETRRYASTARKAFWFMKSFNHMDECANMIEGGFSPSTATVVEILNFLEQITLIFYYWYETLLFFIRGKLLKMDESVIDFRCNLSWCLEDLCAFLSACLQLDEVSKQLKVERIAVRTYMNDASFTADSVKESMKSEVVAENVSPPPSSLVFTACALSDTQIVPVQQRQEKIKALETKKFRQQLSVAINTLELGVSAHYMNVWRLFLPKDLGDGPVGLMGVLSSSLILYEGYLNIRDEI